jgi:hypothetical protein
MRFFYAAILLSFLIASRSRGQTYRLEPDCPPARDTFRLGADARRPASVSGEITSRDTGRPIQRAFVLLAPGNYRSSTDSVGVFRIDRVPEGRYTVMIRATGFAHYTDTLALRSSTGLALHVPLTPQYPDRCSTITRVRVP